MPQHGIFVEWHLRHLIAVANAKAQVLAPLPWVPRLLDRVSDRYGAYARVPSREERYGIPIEHPRYPHMPSIGMNFQARMMALATAQSLKRLIMVGGDFDLIDAHYFYPDGVAAWLLASKLGRPFVITAHGSDVNVVAKYPVPRRMILAASRGASAIIAVSTALRDALLALGVQAQKVVVIRNGVDLNFFKPEAREAARRKLGLECRRLVLSVGNLLENKGHHLVVQALRGLSDCHLVVVGEGEQKDALIRMARACGVANRVLFTGRIPQRELAHYYNAADVVVLASASEGLPSVLLETLACGTPVVATRVGGIPEIVTSREAGLLINTRDSLSIANAVRELLDCSPSRIETSRCVETFSWESVAASQAALFDTIIRETRNLEAPKI